MKTRVKKQERLKAWSSNSLGGITKENTNKFWNFSKLTKFKVGRFLVKLAGLLQVEKQEKQEFLDLETGQYFWCK